MTNLVVDNAATIRYEKNTIFVGFFSSNTIYEIRRKAVKNMNEFGLNINDENLSLFKVSGNADDQGGYSVEKIDDNMSAEDACLTNAISVTEPLYLLPNEDPISGICQFPDNIPPVTDREYLAKILEERQKLQAELEERYK